MASVQMVKGEGTEGLDPVVECIDVESDDTDYSTDQENPGDLYDVSDEEPGHTPVQVPVEVKGEPVEEAEGVVEVVEVVYNSSKYYNKKRTVITEIVPNAEVPPRNNPVLSTQTKTSFIGRYFETDISRMEVTKVEVTEDSSEYRKIKVESNQGDSGALAKVEAGEYTEQLVNTFKLKDEPCSDLFGPREEKGLEKYNSIRTWRMTGLGADIQTGVKTIFGDNIRFRILTYNILSQTSLEKQRRLYKNKKSYLLTWEYRLQGLLREIDSLTPDIICFQEIEFSEEEAVKEDICTPLATRGYSYKGRRRTGTKEDGCAIFFKTEKFQCEETNLVHFRREGLSFLSGSNVGVLCRLKPVSVPQRLVVGTVHLQYGVKKHVTRLAQMAIFLADMHELALCRNHYYPCILAGDFNFEPYTDVHRLLTKGSLNYRDLKCMQNRSGMYPRTLFPPDFGLSDNLTWDRNFSEKDRRGRISSGSLSHGFEFRSVYQYRQERDLYKGFAPPENEVTSFHGRWVSVDHMFYSTVRSNWECQSPDGRIEKHLKLLGKWTLPTGSEISKLGGLPSTIAPSDHLPLAADFLLMCRP